MTRAPSYLDDNTSTFARTCPGFGKTQAQMALAIEVYRTPLHKRAVWAFCRHGWAIVPITLAVLVLTGCTDVQADAAVAADAVQAPVEVREQARREWLEQFAEVRR